MPCIKDTIFSCCTRVRNRNTDLVVFHLVVDEGLGVMIGALTQGVGDITENCTVLDAVVIHIQMDNTATCLRKMSTFLDI